ncbi:hypothetical protein D7Y04_09065 [Corallococcus sp. AB038B]|nr:hypothetical protein D7Y04_09065 [Corallococcus sp. AB038B]
MRVIAIAVAVLLAGAAVAVVVLRGRTVAVEDQAIAPESDDDFAADLKQRPKCWVKLKSSESGKCRDGLGRLYKGACYMANWSECAKYL